MNKFCKKSAVQVLRLLKSGEISPENLFDAPFAKIEEVDVQINAFRIRSSISFNQG